MSKSIVIGIAGGTGSGKTTLIKHIKGIFGNEIVTLSHDDYYKSNDDLSIEERAVINFDHPHAFDTDLMIEQLKELKEGAIIHRPDYDFIVHNRKKETVEVKSAKVIIVEGILIFENRKLLEQFDIKVFVDTDADVRFIRRLLRDVKKRGRTMESVVEQYLTTVKLMHDEFVEPSKKNADIIIPEGGFNTVALSMLTDKISALLKQ
ncbi:MAG: uridine kinase [Peptostreptococcales bacterium]|jgi:uridine kinase